MTKQTTSTKSKAELAAMYGVHHSTLRNWMSRIPNLDLQKGQRLLTPRQVKLVMVHLGDPEAR